MKNKRGIIAATLSGLMALVMLASCASSGMAMDSAKATSEATANMNYAGGAYAEGDYEYATQAEYAEPMDTGYELSSTGEAIKVSEKDYNSEGDGKITGEYEKKIIKNAHVYMTAESATEAYDMLLEYLISNGGYEFTRSSEKNGSYVVINATFKVSPEHFDAVLDYANECGDIRNMNVNADDITSQYYDTQIRLENKRKNLEKYYELLADAYAMDDIIKLQNQIDTITADIEAAEGQLKMWNSLVRESTIDICIQEEADPNKVEDEDVDWNAITPEIMLKRMGNGFKTVCNTIVSLLQWLLIAIVTISPLLVIFAVIVIIVKVSSKKRAAKKAAAKEKKAAESAAAYQAASKGIPTSARNENKPEDKSDDKPEK